jgi:rare lipoprotein A
MSYAIRNLGALVPLALLASCGGANGNEGPETASSAAPVQIGVTDETVKLGAPFTVGATTYTPADTAQYDEVGYASQYGSELGGRSTANGEIFSPSGASAAHKTLPMPSYVEVTALDTGRTILVRVNDRGPLSNDRLIDLSEGAARQLGIGSQGVAGVRVRRVNPPEQEKSVLRQGMTAAERIETPEPLLKVLRDKLAKQPRPSVTVQKPAASTKEKPTRVDAPSSPSADRFIREDGNVPRSAAPIARPASPVAGSYVAQIGAFSSRSRADALARKLGASVKASADGRLFRVRFGPFASEAEATAAARQKGYPQARVYRD